LTMPTMRGCTAPPRQGRPPTITRKGFGGGAGQGRGGGTDQRLRTGDLTAIHGLCFRGGARSRASEDRLPISPPRVPRDGRDLFMQRACRAGAAVHRPRILGITAETRVLRRRVRTAGGAPCPGLGRNAAPRSGRIQLLAGRRAATEVRMARAKR
jgi:hypothetical protein